MSSIFDEREQALEAKFAHDEELKFRAMARRDKMFAQWAAERLQLTGDARDRSISGLLAVQGFPRHNTALLQFLATVTGPATPVSVEEATAALERLGREAYEQVLAGTAAPGQGPAASGR